MPKTKASANGTKTRKKQPDVATGTADGRLRNFACVVYPDSAPADWLQIIGDMKDTFLVSPLHDKDIDPQNQPKKPHYHVIYAPNNKKSPEQARDVFSKFGGVGVEPVQSLRGYARYLIHKDNPEKAQYSADDVRTFGGIDYQEIIGLPTDKYKAIREMIDFVRGQGVSSYAELLEYASCNRNDWFRVLCDNGTIVMKEYLKSRSWQLKQESVSAFQTAHDIQNREAWERAHGRTYREYDELSDENGVDDK